ncbi:unnamed protein product [Rhizoctonia solani]|uniref:Uncharacterized protein n=1 Tax=Rhizoctonia solani TaxID=456999 RepID=A0A8H2XUR0_9AGAM|nr:unnamed protein product [Rhizoctonia solani]
MRISISSFITLAIAASGIAAQPSKRLVSVNPPPSQNARVDLKALPPVDVTPITNAKRFSQGLPPLSPVKRKPHRGGPHRDGGYHHVGTPVEFAPRAQTSSSPAVTVKCNILVKTSGGSSLGYISPVFNDYGEYGTPQSRQTGALEVSFPNTATSGSAAGPLDLLATNNADTINSFPYLSAAIGFMSDGDDLGPGNANYVVITGNSGSTGSGSTPSSSTGNSYVTRTGMSANSETTVWTYDPATQDIRVVWTNTDGSSVPTNLIYFVDTDPSDGDANTLVAAGDVAAFRGLFGCTDTCPEVTLTCVPPA